MPKYAAGAPYNVRRYGDSYHGRSVYYTRHILRDGVDIGVWEDYARNWAEDWKRVQRGDFHLFKGRIIVDEEVSSA